LGDITIVKNIVKFLDIRIDLEKWRTVILPPFMCVRMYMAVGSGGVGVTGNRRNCGSKFSPSRGSVCKQRVTRQATG
jgi:hypothetical protein